MKKCFLLLTVVLMYSFGYAQTDLKNTMVLLQECLNLNTSNQNSTIKLYENTGVIEYLQTNILQRIKLSDLQKVQVNANNAGYSVDIKCIEENGCISFIKNDTASSLFMATAVQFSDMALANTFAENLSTLIIHYKTNEPPLEKVLFKNAEGKTPILGSKKVVDNKPVAVKQPPVTNSGVQDEDADEPEDKPVAEKKVTAKPSKAEQDEAREDKKEELLRKKAEAQEEREAKRAAQKEKNESRRKATEDKDAEGDENAEEKTPARSKRKAAKDKDEAPGDAPEEEADEKSTSRQSKKTSGNKLIEDVGDEEAGGAKSKSGNDFCSQLTTILQSGKDNKFKSIEGKLTNTETKINDSKVKLKGTRKNYLSWFKKERAFISELKSGSDYETIFKEFESIQTQLDECLGGAWDMEDKSNSEEYAKLKTEVKDVEFKKENDETMPSIRVIFLEDNARFTLFLRVR